MAATTTTAPTAEVQELIDFCTSALRAKGVAISPADTDHGGVHTYGPDTDTYGRGMEIAVSAWRSIESGTTNALNDMATSACPQTITRIGVVDEADRPRNAIVYVRMTMPRPATVPVVAVAE